MKNEAAWVPTKFEPTPRGWRGSRDPKNLAVSSRITSDAAIRYYEAYLRKYAGGRLLDLGCGKAPLFGIYRELVTEVTGLDWGGSYHEALYADITADLNEPLPLPDEGFDTILSTSVLEHVRRPELAFDEITRVLAPGGTAIIAVPFLYPLHEVPYDYYRFTRYCLDEMCTERGLTVLELEPFGGLGEAVCDMLAKALRRRRILCRVAVACFQFTLRLARRFRRRKEGIETHPLGYILAARKAP